MVHRRKWFWLLTSSPSQLPCTAPLTGNLSLFTTLGSVKEESAFPFFTTREELVRHHVLTNMRLQTPTHTHTCSLLSSRQTTPEQRPPRKALPPQLTDLREMRERRKGRAERGADARARTIVAFRESGVVTTGRQAGRQAGRQ